MGEEAIFISQTKLARRWGMTVRTINAGAKRPAFPSLTSTLATFRTGKWSALSSSSAT